MFPGPRGDRRSQTRLGPVRAARDLLTGLTGALVIALLGWLAIRGGVRSARAQTSLRDLGTILALLFGILSAVWWHQSARIANELLDDDGSNKARQKDSNTLSGAAATATALALIASVFTGLPWPSAGSGLCAFGLILLVAMSGDDIRSATRISISEGVAGRSVLGFGILAILLGAFVYDQVRP